MHTNPTKVYPGPDIFLVFVATFEVIISRESVYKDFEVRKAKLL